MYIFWWYLSCLYYLLHLHNTHLTSLGTGDVKVTGSLPKRKKTMIVIVLALFILHHMDSRLFRFMEILFGENQLLLICYIPECDISHFIRFISFDKSIVSCNCFFHNVVLTIKLSVLERVKMLVKRYRIRRQA